jgi:RimJ/RimL family protein N-acetyltransferase
VVPTIETARLRLRALRAEDLSGQAEMLADPRFVRHLGGHTFDREESWRKLLGGIGLWAVLGYGYWAVERREDGAFIGQVGFADYKRDMTPSIENMPEMGWVLAPAAHGQGFASEAVTAALGWATNALQGREIVAIIDPENMPSIRVAEKAGFDRRETATYKGSPILLFRRSPG